MVDLITDAGWGKLLGCADDGSQIVSLGRCSGEPFGSGNLVIEEEFAVQHPGTLRDLNSSSTGFCLPSESNGSGAVR